MSYIYTTKTEENFTVIKNEPLRDERMSWKATGLYCYLCSLPPNWKIRKTDLINRKKDGRKIVDSALEELEQLGYLQKEEAKKKDGKFDGYNYYFSDKPKFDTVVQKEQRNRCTFSAAEKVQLVSTYSSKDLIFIIINNNTPIDFSIDAIFQKIKELEKPKDDKPSFYELSSKEKELLIQEHFNSCKEEEALKIPVADSTSPPLALLALLTSEIKVWKTIETIFETKKRLSIAKTIVGYIKAYQSLPSSKEIDRMNQYLDKEFYTPSILNEGMKVSSVRCHEGGFNEEIDPFLSDVLATKKHFAVKSIVERQKEEQNKEKQKTSFIHTEIDDF